MTIKRVILKPCSFACWIDNYHQDYGTDIVQSTTQRLLMFFVFDGHSPLFVFYFGEWYFSLPYLTSCGTWSSLVLFSDRNSTSTSPFWVRKLMLLISIPHPGVWYLPPCGAVISQGSEFNAVILFSPTSFRWGFISFVPAILSFVINYSIFPVSMWEEAFLYTFIPATHGRRLDSHHLYDTPDWSFGRHVLLWCCWKGLLFDLSLWQYSLSLVDEL